MTNTCESLSSSSGSEAASVNMADSGVTGGFWGVCDSWTLLPSFVRFDNFAARDVEKCPSFLIRVLGHLGLAPCVVMFLMLTLACYQSPGSAIVMSDMLHHPCAWICTFKL